MTQRAESSNDSLLRDLLRDAAQRLPKTQAVIDETRTLTYAELDEQASSCALRLTKLGVEANDRVAIVSKNRVEFVVLYFALFELGAVAVPLNWRLRSNELADLIADAGARIAFVETAFRLPVTSFDGRQLALDEVVGPRPSNSRPSRRVADESEIAVQMYTSGTTGRAKGSMLSHANIAAMQRAWQVDMPLDEAQSRFLQVTPLFHVGALLMMVSCVASGATLRLLPEFTAERAAHVLANEGITHALFVPAMLQWLLAEPAVRGGSARDLELVVYGAAPMPVPILRDAIDVLGCEFLQGYGLTETAGVLTTLDPKAHRFAPDEPAPARLASAGKAVSCCEVRVVAADGQPASVGKSGEVVARGTNVHAGYWNRDESDVDDQGWFHTGDVGYFDAEGYLYLVDRVKDMICVAGENVYPSEIERRLLEHDAVRDAAVIGIPNEHWGEEVLALIVPDEGQAATTTQLIQHCRTTLARFKCPTRVEWIDEVPRNAAGKITKALLREPYWRGRERKV